MHDEYWHNVKRDTESRVKELFSGCKTCIREILGDDNGIDSISDAKKILSYVIKHGDSDDISCAIISLSQWCHAHHELMEHGSTGVEHMNNNAVTNK